MEFNEKDSQTGGTNTVRFNEEYNKSLDCGDQEVRNILSSLERCASLLFRWRPLNPIMFLSIDCETEKDTELQERRDRRRNRKGNGERKEKLWVNFANLHMAVLSISNIEVAKSVLALSNSLSLMRNDFKFKKICKFMLSTVINFRDVDAVLLL